MRKKTLFTKTVVTTVATSVLISSCYNGHDFDDCIYGEFAENTQTRGLSLMDINESNLSLDFQKKAHAINKIIQLILSEPQDAKEFASDPQEYLSIKELDFDITLSIKEKNALLAFCDNDVINAVKENNFRDFIKICNERKYITPQPFSTFTTESELREIFKTEEEYENFITTMNINNDGLSTNSEFGVAFAALAVVAVAVAAILVEVGAAIQAVVYLDIEISGLGEASAKNNSNIDIISSTNTNDSVLKIWTDNNGKIGNDIFYSEMIEKQTNAIIDNYVNQFPNIDKDKFSKFVKLQLEGFYGLRK